MKNLLIISLLVFELLLSFSCRNNRLKTNVKELTEEIILQEKKNEEAKKVTREKELADTLNKLSIEPLYKENRSVDPENPPSIIDIAGSLDKIDEFNLSDVLSEIKYIRIEQAPDSAFVGDIRFDYYPTDDYIIAVNRLGILKYNKDGRFLSTVVKNKFTIEEGVIRTFIGASYMQGGGTYYNNISSIGNKMYYTYINTISSQEYRIEYDCSEIEIKPQSEFNPEFPSEILGKGKIVADYNRIGSKEETNASGSKSFLTKWIDKNTYSKKIRGADIYALINKQGDTLSKFPLYEKLINYTKPVGRGTDDGCYYEYKGKSYFRNAYNDTLFHVIPPNRLLPVYVLKLGSYKLTRQQGTDPDFDLTGKIIPEEWVETEKYIFLTFTKDSYDCPNTRKKKIVKIYHALYSKMNHQLSVIKGDPYEYTPEILKNDIDGGLPVWPYQPIRYIASPTGEIIISLKGKDLKGRVKSDYFTNTTAPELKKNALKQLANSVSDSEDILMIVK